METAETSGDWWTVETIVESGGDCREHAVESGGDWRLVEFGGDCRVQRILEAIVETAEASGDCRD